MKNNPSELELIAFIILGAIPWVVGILTVIFVLIAGVRSVYGL